VIVSFLVLRGARDFPGGLVGSNSSDKKRWRPSFTLIWIICCVLYFGGDALWGIYKTESISYSEAIEMVEDSRVSEATIKGDYVILVPNELLDSNSDVAGKNWKAQVLEGSERLEDALATFEVSYEAQSSGWFAQNWGWFVVVGILFILIAALIEKDKAKGGVSSGGGIFGFTKHKGKRAENVDTTYEDVAGYPSVKNDLREVVDFLKNPEKFSRLGAKAPRSVLMWGPSGTGKTLLARATAGEAGVPFFHISGSDFVEMFVGVGAGRVSSLFDEARKCAPCIIFIDEIDAVGSKRSNGNRGGGGSEHDQTINKLLAEMDGFEKETGIIVIAATNRKDSLDSALLTRFARKVLVDLPPIHVREKILEIHAKGKETGIIDYNQVAKLTTGWSGRGLMHLFNEAALLATREDAERIVTDHLIRAIELVVVGHPDTARRLSKKDRQAVAVHEAGHAVARAAMGGAERIVRVSIVPSSAGALGYNLVSPEDESESMLREARELLAEVVVLLAGRAAEREMIQHVTTGASDDLRRANKILFDYVTHYGFDESLKNRALHADETRWSEDTARKVDEAIERLLTECYKHGMEIVKNNVALTRRLVSDLLEEEELSGRLLQDSLRGVEPLAQMAMALSA
jgi:cell division protease FtsH